MKIINTDIFLAMCLFEKPEISYDEINIVRRRLAGDFKDIIIQLSPEGINKALHLYGNSNSQNNFFDYKPSSDIFCRGNDWNRKKVSLELFLNPVIKKIPIGTMISKMKEYDVSQA